MYGFPLPVLGHNEHIAWGFTNVMADDMDFYVEKLNEDLTEYYLDGKWIPLTIKKETMKLRSGDEKEIIILSGDKEVNVEKFAKSIGVDKYHSNKSPEEKLDFIKNKQLEEKIIYVGDGVNDSPSIKQADIGITTSSSSQIAQVAGDILIHKGGLDTISEIFKLSKKSKSRIYQNLFLY